jgi:hypothetical protein
MACVIDSLADRIFKLERIVEVSNKDTFDVVELQRNVNTKRMTESCFTLVRTEYTGCNACIHSPVFVG